MNLDFNNMDIKQFLIDYNEELDDIEVAGLSQKELENRKEILSKIEERYKKERKSYSTEDADLIENLLDNLNARVRAVSGRKRKDGRSLVNAFDQRKSELEDKQREIEEKVEELLKYAYLAGFPIDKGKNNVIADSLNDEMDLKNIYLTEEAAIRFNKDDGMRNQRDKARLDRITTNANVQKFNNLYAYVQELVKERNQLRNECVQLNEKLSDLIYGDLVEGYDSFVLVERMENPLGKNENKEIKDIRNKLVKDFEKAVKGVNTYGDIMKMSLEDIRLLEENLISLNTKNSFDNQLKHAKALAGSNAEALDLVADMEYIQNAYRTTRKVTENIKGIKNASIAQLRTAIKSNKDRISELEKKIVDKEEDVLRIQYILGISNENDLKKFAKANKREIITLTTNETKDKEKIAKRAMGTMNFYTQELLTTQTELKELKELKGRHEFSLESYEKGKANVEAGILNGKYESLINSNVNVTVGMKKLEELRNGALGFQVKHDKNILKVASEGKTLDDLKADDVKPAGEEKKDEEDLDNPFEEEKKDDINLDDPIEEEKKDDINLDDPIEEENIDADIDLSDAIPEDDIDLSDPIPRDEDDEKAAKTVDMGEKMKKSLKERIVPKIKGKLPKAAKVLLTVLGIVSVAGVVGALFAGGTGQLLLTGYLAGKAIDSGLVKKK